MQYRTEIQIAADRYVCLQLPDFIPPGRAIVTVQVTASDDPAEAGPPTDAGDDDPDQDVEWWEEFDDPDPRRG